MKIVKLRNKNNEEVIPKSTVDLQQINESQLDLTNTTCGNSGDYPIYVNKLRKQNKMVTLDFEGYATNFVDGYNLVGTIPTDYLPKTVGYYTDVLMYFNCVVAGMNAVVQGKISPEGEVLIHSKTDNWPVGYMDNNLAFRIHESWFTE